jgi:hypothetical protein
MALDDQLPLATLDAAYKRAYPRGLPLRDLGPATSRWFGGAQVPPEAMQFMGSEAPISVAPSTTAGAAAGMLPGAGLADILGLMPNFEGGTYPSFGQNVKAGRYGQAALQTLGAAGDVMLAVPGMAAAGELAKAARVASETRGAKVTGSFNPLENVPVTFNGKQPHQFSDQDWEAFGKHHGVDNMGPMSKPEAFKTDAGKTFWLPGGTNGKWSYADLLWMKANPINPSEINRPLHIEMQKKLGRTMTPEQLGPDQVWNGLMFGITSPNNPLFPNQMAASRLRLRDPQMLDDLASMIPWRPGETPSAQQRLAVSDQIARRFGLASEEKGGLGVRGSTDYSRVGELAQMFKQDPDFFRKKPDENWGQAVERIASQVPGLSMKTGSFGTVWQDPANAQISAIDRHMARLLQEKGGLFAGADEQKAWQDRSLNLWNSRNPDNEAKSWKGLLKKSGSDGFIGEMLLDHVGNAGNPVFRLKSGEINPNIPAHLQTANWVREPDKVYKMGAAYKRALDLNQTLADESGLNLFMSQWLEWDRIRNRFEPHENMFPGLSKTPAMSMDQLRLVDEAHRATGHKTYGKEEGALQPTRPFIGNPSQLGYLGLGALALPAVTRQQGTAD